MPQRTPFEKTINDPVVEIGFGNLYRNLGDANSEAVFLGMTQPKISY